MTAFIQLDALNVRLGGRPILKDLTGTFSGRCIGLLGPNGAGKTTLLQTLLGFHYPAAGTAKIFGLDVRTRIRELRHRIGYMPETDSYIAGMTAIASVRCAAVPVSGGNGSGDGGDGVQANAIAPPMMASSMPRKNPPRLEAGNERMPSTIPATP